MAIRSALENGFDNVGIDLMYGLPGQNLVLWEEDLKTAVSLGVHQVTTFCLYVPPGTALFRETRAGKVGPFPTEAEKWAMYQLAEELLAGAGYEQYTAYDFAFPGKASKHHAINWQAPQGQYLGMGPGAFSYLHQHIFANVGALDDYMSLLDQGRLPVTIGSFVSRREEMSRFMVLGLKYLHVSQEAFRRRFGISLEDHFGTTIARLEGWGLIRRDAEQVFVTEKGKTYLSNVCKAFYTPGQRGKPQPRV
jgi:oxygen-independent coproporphyrinogen-3 oxidase